MLNYEAFKTIVCQEDNGKTLELLDKIKDEYIKKLKDEINPIEYGHSVKIKYVKCYNCNKYYDKDEQLKNTYTRITTKEECTFKDAGYGDYDEYSTVTRENTYYKCPNCEKEEFVKSRVLSSYRTR